MGTSPQPGPQQKRFADYMEGLASAAGHADRHDPLLDYCTGLLLPGERKSVEPMAARLDPGHVRQKHQSLHHFVAEAPWSDAAMLAQVRDSVLAAMQPHGPVVAWIVDDTGFPKKGQHSVGVARQYCGQVGKQDNCQVAVSVSVASWNSSLPIAYQLYLPESWTKDPQRCERAGVPEEIEFQTKLQIALGQIRQAVQAEVERGVVLADAAYGNDSHFRAGVTELELQYVVGVQSSTTVWKPGTQPLPPKEWTGQGRPAKRLQRDSQNKPVTMKELALELPSGAWKDITWREGSEHKLRSRFASVRVRPAHRDEKRTEPHPEEWLLMEWPREEKEPTKYWLATLPAKTKLKDLVKIGKHRWIIERDYQELKQELGLGHFEGRGWRGFHHHASMCIAAYGFLVTERNRFSPSARAGNVEFSVPTRPPEFQPRGSRASGAA